MVGLGRLERPTSPLSGVRSNHLSYRPESTTDDPTSDSPARPMLSGVRKRNEDGERPACRGLTGPYCSKEIR